MSTRKINFKVATPILIVFVLGICFFAAELLKSNWVSWTFINGCGKVPKYEHVYVNDGERFKPDGTLNPNSCTTGGQLYKNNGQVIDTFIHMEDAYMKVR